MWLTTSDWQFSLCQLALLAGCCDGPRRVCRLPTYRQICCSIKEVIAAALLTTSDCSGIGIPGHCDTTRALPCTRKQVVLER